MASLKVRYLVPGFIVLLFLVSSLYLARKSSQGQWHAKAIELWEKEDWHSLCALSENLHQTGKEDVESYYLAMLASEQLQDPAGVQLFATRLTESRMINWAIEKDAARLYQPESLRKRIALFRTRIVFAASGTLFLFLIFSLRKKEPYTVAPALISAVGLAVLML